MNTEKRNFDNDAENWDEKPRRIKLANEIVQTIKTQVEIKKSFDVMEFGAGTGLIGLQLSPFVNSLTCIDNSQGMLTILQKKIQSQNLQNVKTQFADIENGDLLFGNYDLIISGMTFHHIKNIENLVHQFYKILKPEGLVCVADLDLDNGEFHDDNTGVYHNGFDRKLLQIIFEHCGFKAIKIETASIVAKENIEGKVKDFSVFLLTAQK